MGFAKVLVCVVTTATLHTAVLGGLAQDLLALLQRSRHGSQQKAYEAMSLSTEDIETLQQAVLEMFQHAYGSYMQHAFPHDEVHPLSCKGKDSHGGAAISMIDALDTLMLINRPDLLHSALQYTASHLSFDIDQRVHVFELTIRSLGSLLSTHVLLKRLQAPDFEHYDGHLLRQAEDLARRLLPAFDTSSGLPLSWVNLASGKVPGDIQVTCTACAGTLLLEFGMLSRLTGNDTYWVLAKHAALELYRRRSALDLVGNTIYTDTGAWERRDAGIGAGSDSYYEYLLKGYLLFGDLELLDAFSHLYSAVQHFMRAPPSYSPQHLLVDVHMESGRLARNWITSLSAFWPGLQVLAGQLEDAKQLHGNWTETWRHLKWLPEQFTASRRQIHPSMNGYPLRPELMESTYLLYTATGASRYQVLGATMLMLLNSTTRVPCGFATVGDVTTGRLEDSMESFFLSETLRYLYLLFTDIHGSLPDYLLFTTEGHVFHPVRHADFSEASDTADRWTDTEQSPLLSQGVPPVCASACGLAALHEPATAEVGVQGGSAMGVHNTDQQEAGGMTDLKRSFPALVFKQGERELLLHRRCMACAKVADTVMHAKLPPAPTQIVTHDPNNVVEYVPEGPLLQPRAAAPAPAADSEQCSADASAQKQTVLVRQVVCHLASAEGQLHCAKLTEVSNPQRGSISGFPAGTVVLQITAVHGSTSQEFVGRLVTVDVKQHGVGGQFQARGAHFGPQFGTVQECQEGADSIAAAADEDDYEDSDMEGSEGDEGFGAQWSTAASGAPIVCKLQGRLVAAEPFNLCAPLIEAQDGRYKRAVLLGIRGGCAFVKKAQYADEAGAVGLVLLNEANTQGVVAMSGDGLTELLQQVAVVMVGARNRATLVHLAASGQAQVELYPGEWDCPEEDDECISEVISDPVQQQVELLLPSATHMWLARQSSTGLSAHEKQGGGLKLEFDGAVMGQLMQLLKQKALLHAVTTGDLDSYRTASRVQEASSQDQGGQQAESEQEPGGQEADVEGSQAEGEEQEGGQTDGGSGVINQQDGDNHAGSREGRFKEADAGRR